MSFQTLFTTMGMRRGGHLTSHFKDLETCWGWNSHSYFFLHPEVFLDAQKNLCADMFVFQELHWSPSKNNKAHRSIRIIWSVRTHTHTSHTNTHITIVYDLHVDFSLNVCVYPVSPFLPFALYFLYFVYVCVFLNKLHIRDQNTHFSG